MFPPVVCTSALTAHGLGEVLGNAGQGRLGEGGCIHAAVEKPSSLLDKGFPSLACLGGETAYSCKLNCHLDSIMKPDELIDSSV